jgi:Membrane protein involved in colicin uptake
MLDYSDMEKIQTIKLNHLPNANSLLKISLGLIFFTILSTALVYAETIPVDVDGTSFNVEYTATGMTVSGIESDTDFISLILTVDVTESSGTLDITLDRSLLDSTFQGLDDDFILLADGDEPVFSEIATSQSRTLSIELPAGTEEIEIIGSVFGNSVPVDVISDVDDGADKAAADKAAADKAAADKAAADKAAADKTTPTQCGPGTILKNGACVLDERCGPGTILMDGACVVDPTQSSGSTSKGMGTDFATGMIYAIVIAGAILLDCSINCYVWKAIP